MNGPRKLLASLFIVIWLAPHVGALLRPFENWPWTSAPMFAHRVGKETPLYRFRWVGEYSAPSPREKTLRARDFGFSEVKLMRYFFPRVYGSMDPESPWLADSHDTPEKFEIRLGRFFSTLVHRLEKTPQRQSLAEGLQGIRLEIVKTNLDGQGIAAHKVGRYDVGGKYFIRA